MEILKCEICEACFKSEMALAGHQISVHGSRDSHPCKLCAATFSDYSTLTSHITSVHLKPKPYGCLKCSESFMTIEGMMEHVTVHEEQNGTDDMVHEEVKHQSNFDSMRCDDIKFQAESVQEEIMPYKCSVCDLGFTKRRQFNGHLSTHKLERKFKCKICDFRFKKTHHLTVHLKAIHGDKINQDQIATVHEAEKSSYKVEKEQGLKEKTNHKMSAQFKLDSNSAEKKEVKRASNLEKKSSKLTLKKEIHKVTPGLGEKQFKCKVCNKKIAGTKYHLNRHIKRVHGRKALELCDRVSKTSKLKKNLKLGVHSSENTKLAIHKRNKKFKCRNEMKDEKDIIKDSILSEQSKVDQSFAGKESLEPNHFCTPCGKSFSYARYLKRHNNKFHEKTENSSLIEDQYICQFCGYEPKTKNKWQDREDHWVAIHFKVELDKLFPGQKNVWKPYHPDICPLEGCDYRGKSKQTLMRHYTSKHIVHSLDQRYKKSIALATEGLKNDSFDSITSDRIFGGDENKEIQQLESTANAKRNKNTLKSSKTTKAAEIQPSSQLKLNKKSFLKKEEKPFLCQYCMKRFKKRYYMQMHEKVHTGEAFLCKLCEKSFSLAINLKMHERLHTGDKPFSCRHCDQTFSQKINAQGHERTHTGEKPFSCEYCDKRFPRKDTLKIHRRRHTEEKPKCNYCGKEFLTKQHVKKHEENLCKKNSETTQDIDTKIRKKR